MVGNRFAHAAADKVVAVAEDSPDIPDGAVVAAMVQTADWADLEVDTAVSTGGPAPAKEASLDLGAKEPAPSVDEEDFVAYEAAWRDRVLKVELAVVLEVVPAAVLEMEEDVGE